MKKAERLMNEKDTEIPRFAVHTPGKTWEVSMTGEALTIGRHPQSNIALCDAILIGNARLVFKHKFSSEDLTLTDLPKRLKKVKRHPVVFVPGLTGSELWRGSERVWSNLYLRLWNQNGHKS